MEVSGWAGMERIVGVSLKIELKNFKKNTMSSTERFKYETLGCWLGWLIFNIGIISLFTYLESANLASFGTLVLGFINLSIISAILANCLDDHLTTIIIKRIALKEHKARQARIAEQERQRRREQANQMGLLTQAVEQHIQTLEQRRGHVPGRTPQAQERRKSEQELLFEKYEKLLMDLLKIDNVDITGHGEEVNVMGGDRVITTFRIKQLPGCCGVGVSTGVEVRPTFQNMGVSTLMNKFRQEYAKLLSYGVLLCTDVESNIAQQKVLKKNKWKKLHSFRNPKTSNQVAIHCIDLN